MNDKVNLVPRTLRAKSGTSRVRNVFAKSWKLCSKTRTFNANRSRQRVGEARVRGV